MFKVMSRAHRQTWHVEHFATEAEARQYANKEYKHGAADIELYERQSNGYKLIDAVHVSKKQAIENFAETAAEDAPYFI